MEVVERLCGLSLLALTLTLASASAGELKWGAVQAMLDVAQDVPLPPGVADLCWQYTDAGTQLYQSRPDQSPVLLPGACSDSTDAALTLLVGQVTADPQGPAVVLIDGTVPTDALLVPRCPPFTPVLPVSP